MGNRAVVYFEGRDGIYNDGKKFYSTGVYLHWSGDPEKVLELLAQTNIRKYDPCYASARFCYTCCKNIDPDGNLSVGLFPSPKSLPKSNWAKHAKELLCDNGFYIVSCIDGEVTQVPYGGNGEVIGKVSLRP